MCSRKWLTPASSAVSSRAGANEETQGRGIGLAVALGDDFQTVFQNVIKKHHSRASNARLPSVTTVKSRGGCSAR